MGRQRIGGLGCRGSGGYLCDALDHVSDQTSHGPQTGDVFSPAVPDDEFDFAVTDFFDFHVDVAERLCEFATGAFDCYEAGFDIDRHTLGDLEVFVFVDVFHLDTS